MGMIKDRNGKDLTEQKRLRRSGKNTQKNCIKKVLKTQITSMITHLEPDIIQCEVNWALGSITTNKARGGDGIPAELFQILKVDASKVLESLCQQIWKAQQGHRTGKVQFSSQFQRRAVLRDVQTTRQLFSLPMLIRLCSKSFKLGFRST